MFAMTDTLERAADLARAAQLAERAHARAIAERDTAIRAALHAGVPAAQLARELDLNRSRIYQIAADPH